MASVNKRRWIFPIDEKKEASLARCVGMQKRRTFPKRRYRDLYRAKIDIELSRETHAALAEQMTFERAVAVFSDRMRERVAAGRIGDSASTSQTR